MALDGVSQLGKVLGGTISDQTEIKQNISPYDTPPIDILKFSEELISEGVLTVTKFTYASDSFIIDHPVLGIIDSPTLKIDGGYVGAEISLPLTVPFEFELDEIVATYII